jgi:uncharacterized membrane protein YgdD (TMEM256/DUF423 family)
MMMEFACMERLWVGLGGLAGLGAVAMAAAAAHALNDLPPGMLHVVESGVQMQGWHALALVACGVWAERHGGSLVHWAGAAFAIGLLLFCGAVYGLALGGIATGPMAPIGGVLLMLGWLLLAVSALRR